MELGFLGPSHYFRDYFCISGVLAARGELAEVDVEPVHGVHAAQTRVAFELSEGGAVFSVLLRPFPKYKYVGRLF